MPRKTTSSGPIDDAIKALRNFRTRADAINRLAELGARAVEPLIAVARERGPMAVRWSAVRALGEIGDAQAVPCLTEMLEQPDLRATAADALMQITGARPADPDAATGDARHSTDVLAACLDTLGKVTHKGRDYEVAIGAVASRQRVLVRFPKPEDADKPDALVVVYAKTGSGAEAEQYERLLKLNPQLPFGAVGIMNVAGAPEFVLVDTHLRRTLDPPELMQSVTNVGTQASEIHERLAK